LSLFVGFFLTLVEEKAHAQAVASPSINCTQDFNNEDIILGWDVPSDPGGNFIAYHVYSAIDPDAPFTLVATLNNFFTSSYIFDQAAPPSTEVCFYIQTEFFEGGVPTLSEPGPVSCSIFLDVSPSAAPQGLAFLDWNNPVPNGTGGQYTVQMEYPAGIWTILATLDQEITAYSHEISVCDEFLNFRILFDFPGLCQSSSNVAGELLTDLTPPAIPVVTSVSIDHTSNDAVINWLPSTSADCQGYIVYRCLQDGTVTLLDTAFGYLNTNFVDILAQTTIGPVGYVVAAIDTCYSGIPPSPNTSAAGDICNTSVFLNPIGYALCEDFVTLSWTPYEGWEEGVENYEIIHSFEGGAAAIVATLPGTELSFQHGVTVGGNNSYYVRARHPNGTYSTISNLRIVNVIYPPSPAFNYITSATVLTDDKIRIEFITEPVGSDILYTVQRQTAGTQDWDDITYINSSGLDFIEYEDSIDVNTDIFSYEYRFVAQNVCGDTIDTSNVAVTILLNGFAYNDRLALAMQWSPYEGWEDGVNEYLIYRKQGLEGIEEEIASVPGNVTFYEDDVSDLRFSPGDFTYRVEAVSRTGTYPEVYYSSSNPIRLNLEPIIWVPNAFVVDGFNNTFQPVISFANFEEYRLIIYSKWGDVIYDTTDINAPWDGFMNGELVQEGVYVYFVTIEDGKGRPVEKRGTVLLLSDRDQ
jgi:gliding motility-associated-like protein